MNLKKEYRELEMRVHSELRTRIEQSKESSKFMDAKAIKVNNLEDYCELVIVNDRLTFLNQTGYHYDIFSVSLEDLLTEYW